MTNQLNTEIFIKRANHIFGDKYDYSKSIYTYCCEPITIICEKHGEFQMKAESHITHKIGCVKCSSESKFDTLQTFIDKAKLKHGDKYDYSKVVYIKSKLPVEIICKKHGSFLMTPNNHVKNYGCKKCSLAEKTFKMDDVIAKCKEIHGDKFDYSKVEYKNMNEKITIICKNHGEFYVRPSNHIYLKSGCPNCCISKNEKLIEEYLIQHNIKYEKQKSYDDCVYKYKLRFDFYLPEFNLCIEYDGEQHFIVKECWGGLEGLIEIQTRDKIKTDYCLNNNINLFRINYKQKTIEMLNKFFNIK